MHRRDLIKRTGAISAGAALAGGSLPIVGPGAAAVFAQDGGFEVWTTYTDTVRPGIIESLGESFGEANGVTVSHRAWPQEELMSTLPRTVDSDQGPDVAQVNNAEALQGPMARAGQILSLQPYDEEYGWSERFPEGLLARCRYSSDGTVFGEGELWGLPAESEIVGFFYRKSTFAEHGLEVPTSLAEFEELLAALRGHGVEPIVYGTQDGWQAIHMLGELHGTNTTREYLDGLIYRRGEADFNDPSILEAATKLVEWKDAGYFMEGFEGITGDDGTATFTSGIGALLMQGSWAAGQVNEGMGDDAGFFVMPPANPDVPVLHVGGVGTPFSITANAEDPDMAGAFIDTLVSDAAFEAFVEAGSLPIGEIPDDLIVEGTLSGDLYAAWNSALANDGLGHFMDWAAPGIYDVMVAELQKLLAGQVTPEEFQANLQEFYAASFE